MQSLAWEIHSGTPTNSSRVACPWKQELLMGLNLNWCCNVQQVGAETKFHHVSSLAELLSNHKKKKGEACQRFMGSLW